MSGKSSKVSGKKRELKELLDQWGKKSGKRNLSYLTKKIKHFKHKKKNKPYTWEHFLVYAQKKGILDKLKDKKKSKPATRKLKKGVAVYITFFLAFIFITALIILLGYCAVNMEKNGVSSLKTNFFSKGNGKETINKKWLEKRILSNMPLLFKYDSIELLNRDEKQKLFAVISDLEKFKQVELVLEGHSHSTGSPEKEQKIALQRTKFIRKKLESAKNVKLTISTKSFGSGQPVNKSDSRKSRHLNRRVEIKILRAK